MNYTIKELAKVDNLNKEITFNGWVNFIRLLGKISFIELRDISGKIQLVIINKNLINNLKDLTPESCISVRGILQKKQNCENEFELLVNELTIYSIAKEMPFTNSNIKEISPSDETVQKYRDVYLRTEYMQNIILMRSKVSQIVRNYFYNLGFLEIETPILGKSTPEGARDYLVPSRVNIGKFYALPQSPQIYKQILMASGMQRYFQIAKCFRDEDLRADRQPEFTQIDLEMSFVDEKTVMNITENLIKKIWKEIKGVDLNFNFKTMDYMDAIKNYGTDKPDLRYGLVFKENNTEIYFEVEENINIINYLKSNSKLNFKLNNGIISVIVNKSISEFDLEPYFILGSARVDIAKLLNLNKGEDKFLWVVNFPMFEFSKTANRFVSMHHPFTMPVNLETSIENIKSKAYDIVLNGFELGGGSIRIHDLEMQYEIFRLLNLTDREIDSNFGFFLNIFKRGIPPHGGLALGLDRLIMLLAGIESIRDVIAFPKTKNAEGLLEKSPSKISDDQLSDLGLNFKRGV